MCQFWGYVFVYITGTSYFINCIACVSHITLRLKRSAYFVDWKFLYRSYGSIARRADLKGALHSLYKYHLDIYMCTFKFEGSSGVL